MVCYGTYSSLYVGKIGIVCRQHFNPYNTKQHNWNIKLRTEHKAAQTSIQTDTDSLKRGICMPPVVCNNMGLTYIPVWNNNTWMMNSMESNAILRWLSFLFWPLCCLFFFNIQILISPLVASNSSYNNKLSTEIVNNSSNINKTNNHFSRQFFKYKTYDIGNPDPGLGQTQTCGGVKPVKVSEPSPHYYWIYNGNIYIYK